MHIQNIIPKTAICMFGVACFDPIVGEWSVTERCYENESASESSMCIDYPVVDDAGNFNEQNLIVASDHTGSIQADYVTPDGTILASEVYSIVAQKNASNEYTLRFDETETTEDLYYDCNLRSNTLVCIEDWYDEGRYVINFERQ